MDFMLHEKLNIGIRDEAFTWLCVTAHKSLTLTCNVELNNLTQTSGIVFYTTTDVSSAHWKKSDETKRILELPNDLHQSVFAPSSDSWDRCVFNKDKHKTPA